MSRRQNDGGDNITAQMTPVYSGVEETLLVWLHTMGAFASVVGSCVILYHVLGGKKTGRVYHRLLLSLAIVDVITGACNVIASHTKHRQLRTPGLACSIEDYITVFSTASSLYLGAVAFYFLFIIRYQGSDKKFAKRYERFFHFTCLIYPFVMATISLCTESLNPNYPYGLGCWLNRYPMDCEGDDCIHGQWANLLSWFATTLPLVLVLVCLVICNILIYLAIRSVESAAARFRFSASMRIPSNYYNNNDDDDDGNDNPSNQQETPQTPMGVSGSDLNARAGDRSASTTVMSGVLLQRNSMSSLSVGRSVSFQRPRSSERLRKVAVQSFLYVAAYIIVYFWSGLMHVTRLIDRGAPDKGWWFPIMALHAFFWPMQGLASMVVYLRPRYMRWRSQNQHRSKWFSFRMAVCTYSSPRRIALPTRPTPEEEEEKRMMCAWWTWWEWQQRKSAKNEERAEEALPPERRTNERSVKFCNHPLQVSMESPELQMNGESRSLGSEDK